MVFEENEPGIFEFKNKDDELTGVLIKVQENIGDSKSHLYTLEVNEKPVSIWGCAILDQRMIGIKIGSLIKVIYKGLGEAKPFKNAPKLFTVLVDRPEKPTEQVVVQKV